MGVILDTGILIAEERLGRSVLDILKQIESSCGDAKIGVSVITIAELTHGAYRATTESRKRVRLTFIDDLCNDLPVFPLTIPIARSIGQVEAQMAAKGLAVAFEDLAIGVTALYMGYSVATLNEKHFRMIPELTLTAL